MNKPYRKRCCLQPSYFPHRVHKAIWLRKALAHDEIEMEPKAVSEHKVRAPTCSCDSRRVSLKGKCTVKVDGQWAVGAEALLVLQACFRL